jgi:two-component system, sensor histidine kinase
VAAVGLAKARFFAAVSHDLRQPVHAIGLYLAPLLAGTKDQRTEKAVQGIYQSWHALDDLLSHVLDLTQMDAGKIQAELSAVELAPLVTGLVVQHSAAAEKKSIRILALVAPQRYVLADMLMLKRVLSNLLDNAIKFSPEDARIAIAVRSVGADWCIQVRDSGPGIALALQAKVFEEFVQIDNPERDRTQGLGLGLAIAQRFTVLMQGQMHLRSASGAGSCLSVHLPKAQGPAIDLLNTSKASQNQMAQLAPQAALTVPDALRKAVRASGKSILVVEDDALVAQAIMQLLADLELPAVHAANAADAMRLAPQICMAACDVRLPGAVSGLDLAIRLQHMQIASLLMTGETGSDTKEAAQNNGLLLLIKPVNPQALLDALASLQLPQVQMEMYAR